MGEFMDAQHWETALDELVDLAQSTLGRAAFRVGARAILHELRQREAAPASAVRPRVALTTREREIVSLLELGFTNAEVAERIGTSIHTVRNQVSEVYRKLGVRNRIACIRAMHDTSLASRR